MLSFVRVCRYCTKVIAKDSAGVVEKKLPKVNFEVLKHPSKVPKEPVSEEYHQSTAAPIEIDSKTIQLLERLSLVDLDSKEALKTLISSIQFAEKITHIDTENIEPLYTVLEQENLYLREDQVTEGNCRKRILQNAAVTDEDYFVSPPGNIPLEQEEKNFDK